jgi:antitoxin component of MazEF toxin-antitoxin module
MKPVELKVARIGNSRGVRLPAKTLQRYRIADAVVMEERSEGILLRPPAAGPPRLSWEETAQAMAAAGEDWGGWDGTAADGLETIPWDQPKGRRVAERPRPSGRKARRR